MSSSEMASLHERIGKKVNMMFNDDIVKAVEWADCTHMPWIDITPLEMMETREGSLRLLGLLDDYFDSHPEIEERYREKQSSTGDGD